MPNLNRNTRVSGNREDFFERFESERVRKPAIAGDSV
jgi:hypothetical protein